MLMAITTFAALVLLVVLALVLYAQVVPPVEVDPTDHGLVLTIRRRSITHLVLCVQAAPVRTFARVGSGALTIPWDDLPFNREDYIRSRHTPTFSIIGRSTIFWFAATVVCTCRPSVQSVSQVTRYSLHRPTHAAT